MGIREKFCSFNYKSGNWIYFETNLVNKVLSIHIDLPTVHESWRDNDNSASELLKFKKALPVLSDLKKFSRVLEIKKISLVIYEMTHLIQTCEAINLSRRRLVRRKWPRWLTPKWISKPSSVFKDLYKNFEFIFDVQ